MTNKAFYSEKKPYRKTSDGLFKRVYCNIYAREKIFIFFEDL
jgi:hypothetical protein